MARMVRAAVLASALLVIISADLAASLGGSVATVEVDRARTKSALVRINRTNDYSVHELQAPTGTLIREYYGTNGIVFGVAWDGEWHLDVDSLRAALDAAPRAKAATQRRKLLRTSPPTSATARARGARRRRWRKSPAT